MTDKIVLLVYTLYIISIIVSIQGFSALSMYKPEYFKNGNNSFIIIICLCFIPIFNVYLVYESIRLVVKSINDEEEINGKL